MNERSDPGADLVNESGGRLVQIFSKCGIEDFNEKDGDILRKLILKDDTAGLDCMIPTNYAG
ncbi:MAG: hypothetical protein NPIRA06_31000 [Nitrospirales bacterium]|nr:MAG: hypothetical protein NPIRA06_31000 [Nitrospirales bacterium]